MKICTNCGKSFPTTLRKDGVRYVLGGRKVCLECNPYKSRKKGINKNDYDGITKTCGKCKENQPKDKFSLNKVGLPRSYCKHCQVEYNLTKELKNKIRAVKYLGGLCSTCGERRVACLSFHHKNPIEKEFVWHQIRTRTWNKQVIELDKCICLCLNCHAIEHATRIGKEVMSL
jgi:hypothetical protein